MSKSRNQDVNYKVCYCLGKYLYYSGSYANFLEYERAFPLTDSIELFLEDPTFWEQRTRPEPITNLFCGSPFPSCLQQARPIFKLLVDARAVDSAKIIERQFYDRHFDTYFPFQCVNLERMYIQKVQSVTFVENSCELNKPIYQLGLKESTASYEKVWNKSKGETEEKVIAVLSKYKNGGFFGTSRNHANRATALIQKIKSKTEREMAAEMQNEQNYLHTENKMDGDYAATIAAIAGLIEANQREYLRFIPNLLASFLQGNVHAEIACEYLDMPCRFVRSVKR